ncbi:MAG TPA: endonuclease III [Bacteroidota bacterium]|nr:endonuclease III [Bacteroidota bacterium]
MKKNIDWIAAFKPLFRKYRGRKHPLHHENRYQLLVMVVLSARSTDQKVNAVAPELFRQFPSMEALAAASPEDLRPYIKGVTNFYNKAGWLITLARIVKEVKNIPTTMEALTELPGIGRKSANVILSESGLPPEGVIVDVHVMRVAPRIGIANGSNPEQIEKQLMEKIPKKHWKELGMSLTYLGREICRPTDPHFCDCPLTPVCAYYASVGKALTGIASVGKGARKAKSGSSRPTRAV